MPLLLFPRAFLWGLLVWPKCQEINRNSSSGSCVQEQEGGREPSSPSDPSAAGILGSKDAELQAKRDWSREAVWGEGLLTQTGGAVSVIYPPNRNLKTKCQVIILFFNRSGGQFLHYMSGVGKRISRQLDHKIAIRSMHQSDPRH